MRALIVLGGTKAIHQRLRTRWQIITVDTPAQALEELDQYPQAVLAYGPGVFGNAVTRQPARIYTPEPQVIVTDSVDYDSMGEDDPRRLVERAAATLRAHLVLNVSLDGALEALDHVLNDRKVPA